MQQADVLLQLSFSFVDVTLNDINGKNKAEFLEHPISDDVNAKGR